MFLQVWEWKVLRSTLTGFCMEVPLWPRLKKGEKVSSSQGSATTGNLGASLGSTWDIYWSSVFPSVDSIPSNANILSPGIVLIGFPHFQKHKNRSGNLSYNKNVICIIILIFHKFLLYKFHNFYWEKAKTRNMCEYKK